MKINRFISRHLTSQTQKPNSFYYNGIHRDPTRELHARHIRTHNHRNSNLMSEVIKSYSLSMKSQHKAHCAFRELDEPTLHIYNHMLRVFSKGENPHHALYLFDKLREQGLHANNLTFIYSCNSCARVKNVMYGEKIHGCVTKLGFTSYLYVGNAMIHMYGYCGHVSSMRRVFEEMMIEKDLVTWNSLICGYSQSHEYRQVLSIFSKMRVENVTADHVTMVKVVMACNFLNEWKLVDEMVDYIEANCIEIDVYLGNTLIDAYGSRGLITIARSFFNRMTKKNIVSWNAMITGTVKSGDLVEAKKLFDEMPERDVVSWTSMITGCTQANQYNDAIDLFQEMMVAKVKPDQMTIASVLSSCAHSGRFDLGETIHNYITSHDIKSDIYVENALVDMYCKCGSVEKALILFHKMQEKDSVSWTSIITGLAVNGDEDRAFEFFSQMLREGKNPTHGTFVGLLLACVHGGSVDKGLEFFHSMQREYELVPETRHYGCVVDLLCRSGEVFRAYEFIKHMPIKPDVVLWRILLSACRVHGNIRLAKIASDKLIELDPTNGGNYVLSSNSYAIADKWEDALRVRELIYGGNVVRPLGWSSVETIKE